MAQLPVNCPNCQKPKVNVKYAYFNLQGKSTKLLQFKCNLCNWLKIAGLDNVATKSEEK